MRSVAERDVRYPMLADVDPMAESFVVTPAGGRRRTHRRALVRRRRRARRGTTCRSSPPSPNSARRRSRGPGCTSESNTPRASRRWPTAAHPETRRRTAEQPPAARAPRDPGAELSAAIWRAWPASTWAATSTTCSTRAATGRWSSRRVRKGTRGGRGHRDRAVDDPVGRHGPTPSQPGDPQAERGDCSIKHSTSDSAPSPTPASCPPQAVATCGVPRRPHGAIDPQGERHGRADRSGRAARRHLRRHPRVGGDGAARARDAPRDVHGRREPKRVTAPTSSATIDSSVSSRRATRRRPTRSPPQWRLRARVLRRTDRRHRRARAQGARGVRSLIGFRQERSRARR